MGSDSDDDFQRFLQEDDSASVSSASPVKRKVSKDTKTSKKKVASSAKGASGRASSSSSRPYGGGGGASMSVVAAAEKLLAASGRAGTKRQPAVQEAEDDDDEPPPSYSDDPYAFDLGDAPSRYSRKSDEEVEDDDNDSAYRSASRRAGKSKQRKTSRDASAKPKKTKAKSKEKEPPAAKGEAKSAKTLEDRIADILKRTGSTAYPAGAGAAEDKLRGDDERMEDSDGYDDGTHHAETKKEINSKRDPSTTETKTITSGGRSSRNVRADADEQESHSDEGSQPHRLSFSDSLGLESADFEVGALAKRKLDRSRLSLSSLNSEKFAVNLNALEESDHVSQNRYDLHNEDVSHSIDVAEPTDSDYDDEGFELDQTTEVLVETADTTNKKTSPLVVEKVETSFVSQFESMKSLFSLESPIKPVETTTDVQPDPPIPAPSIQSGPSEYDNFGYDDEDFEADEAVPDDEQKVAAIHTDISSLRQADEVEDYGNEAFDDGQEQVIRKEGDISAESHDISAELGRERATHSEAEPVTVRSPFQFEVVSTIVSVTETRAESADKTEKNVTTELTPCVPTPPKSPPPPPPPDDEPEKDAEKSSVPPLPPPSLAPPSQPLAPAPDGSSRLKRSTDRVREIEHHVSSLRFVPGSSHVDHQQPTHFKASLQEEEATNLVDDPHTLQEIQEIEQLVQQAKRVRHERRKSASMRSSVKESELALRLQQAQRQLLHFKHHVQELVESGGESSPLEEDVHACLSQEDKSSVGKNVGKQNKQGKIARKEVEDLKKEVHSQERLIQGFQRENEQLMKQMKQLQRDLQYDTHKENEALKIELKELRVLLDGAPPIHTTCDGIESKVHYRAAIEARLQAEAHAASLQEELKSQARRHQERVNELKLEIEKVKKAKIELECRYEGISIEKMEAESQQIRVLQEKLKTQKAEHDHAVSALQKKIDWYVRNQRLLDEQDEKMNELKAENTRLRDELASPTTDKATRESTRARSPRTPAKVGLRLASDVRRIQELESRLSDMEEAMRKRHPDSLVSLMVASRKADEESKLQELAEEHKRELSDVMDEMERLDANNEKKLNSFRQQQEKLVLQYQKQISELERQLANKENTRGLASAHAKPQKKMSATDEDELHRVRRFYAEKIKEVERKWEAKYRAAKKQHYAANGPVADSLTHEQGESSPSDAARIIRTLHQRISSQEEEIRRLRGTGHSTSGLDGGDLRRRISSLETQLKTSEDARRHLIATISSLSAMTPPPFSSETRPHRSVQDESRREQELEAKLVATRHEHEQVLAQYRDQIKSLEHQVAHESIARQQLATTIERDVHEVERLQKVLAEAEHERRRLQQSAERVATLESEVFLLRDQMSIPQTPSMLQFRSLELRIETLTQKHQLREAELKMLLAQATQSSELEKLNYERMYRNAIALKNAEINTFKRQLGEILDELEALPRTPSSPA